MHPHPRIVSLWDMLKTNGHWFVSVLHTLGFCEGALDGDRNLGKPTIDFMLTQMQQMIDVLPQVDLPATVASIRSAKLLMENREGVSLSRLSLSLGQIRANLGAELESRNLWLLSSEENNIYLKQTRPFGSDVQSAFPDTREDLEEATICLALGRNAACVFHLMRAMERCVISINSLLSGMHKEMEWGKLVSSIKAEIDKMPKGKTKEDWCHVNSLLFAVKEAWRNNTMHPKQYYSSDQAKEVYRACESFMRYLAIVVQAHGAP